MNANKVFASLLFCMLLMACSHTEQRDVSSKSPKKSWGEIELLGNGEKLMLLSKIKHLPYDTVYLILKDYHDATHHFTVDSSQIFAENAIANVSRKCAISEEKIDSVIFSYKFEQLTREDILEDAETLQRTYEDAH